MEIWMWLFDHAFNLMLVQLAFVVCYDWWNYEMTTTEHSMK